MHGSPPSSRRGKFIAKLSKKTVKILPTPPSARLRARVHTLAAPPRRSQRLAGIAPETPCGALHSRSKKKVMHALDIIGETEGIDQQSVEKYSKLFTAASSLTYTHVHAMSGLFG